jgi:hypothetical protein
MVLKWEELNDKLRDASEKSTLKLLQQAQDAGAAPHYLLRIYGRYSKMRKQRELEQILRGGKVNLVTLKKAS